MAATQHELDEHLKAVRKQVKQNSLEYITVAGVEVGSAQMYPVASLTTSSTIST